MNGAMVHYQQHSSIDTWLPCATLTTRVLFKLLAFLCI